MIWTEPRCAPPENSCSSGISAICRGTTCSAKMMKKIVVDGPRNRIHAQRIAAIDANARKKGRQRGRGW